MYWQADLLVGVAGVAGHAGAHWVVSRHPADSVPATAPGTEVHALAASAAPVLVTVRVAAAAHGHYN